MDILEDWMANLRKWNDKLSEHVDILLFHLINVII